jgi:hypothetical protein
MTQHAGGGAQVSVTIELGDGSTELPKGVMATFALDVSGSMGSGYGSRLETSLDGMTLVFNEVLEDHDRIELMTFSSEVKVLHGHKKKYRVDWGRNMDSIRQQRRGATALYDAVFKAIETIPRGAEFKGVRERKFVRVCWYDHSLTLNS